MNTDNHLSGTFHAVVARCVKQYGAIEAKEATRETLLYRQGFDGTWYLRDAKGNHIGTFASPAFVKQWCDDNGYRCRQG